MNLKINREPVSSLERICSCVQEQSVELDYVLPDYYAEIFRIVKCCAEPKITACAVSEDRINYELTVDIRVIYCSETGEPQALEQKLTYSRTVNTDRSAENPSVYIRPSADYMNCRAAGKRRIDIRGAVSINITAVGETECRVISDVFGEDVQLRKTDCLCPSSVIRAQKRVTFTDELDMGDNPPVGNVLRCSARVLSPDKKIIAGKAAAKGELGICLVYTPSATVERTEDDDPVCRAEFSLPFSQLIDMDGLDADYDCFVRSEVLSSTVIPRSEGDGDSSAGRLEFEALMFIDCIAVKTSVYEIAIDEYSTLWQTSHSRTPVKTYREPVNVDSTVIVKGVCGSRENPLDRVYDVCCDISKLSARNSGGALSVAGTVRFSVMGQTANGDFIICECDTPVEEKLTPSGGDNSFSEQAVINIGLTAAVCTYTITSENLAEVKAEISVRGRVEDNGTVNALTDIAVDETAPRESKGDYALKLFFARQGEEVWDIAKSCGASIKAVMEENELTQGALPEDKMLIIPN